MSKVFICAAIPDELATREEGAVAVATAIEAGDERRARAKFHWQFLEHYPAAQDCAYKFIVCEDMGPEFSKTIDLETAGGVIDRDTIKWWLKQSREAQSAIMTDEIPLDDALLQLREFIDENSGEFFVQVWGNGANFDNTILRRSYERQGIPCPWRYYNDRDVRTIVELGKAIDFDARTAIPFEGERHNALDDARYQAKYVSVIWQKLIPSQADS